MFDSAPKQEKATSGPGGLGGAGRGGAAAGSATDTGSRVKGMGGPWAKTDQAVGFWGESVPTKGRGGPGGGREMDSGGGGGGSGRKGKDEGKSDTSGRAPTDDEKTKVNVTGWGDVITTFNGVVVYSNGGSNSTAQKMGPFGLKYQCAEYASAYLGVHYWKDGADFGGTGNLPGHTWVENGTATELPKSGDVLSWGGDPGHVAICTSAGETGVHIVQQNVLPARETIPLTKEGTKYTMGSTVAGTPSGWQKKS